MTYLSADGKDPVERKGIRERSKILALRSCIVKKRECRAQMEEKTLAKSLTVYPYEPGSEERI